MGGVSIDTGTCVCTYVLWFMSVSDNVCICEFKTALGYEGRVGTIKDLQPTAPVLKAGHPGVLCSLCW